ncbi:MAG: hypothetical protein ACK4NW_10045 [Roseinatronobacter sp.]
MSKRNDLITRANALELTFAKNISNKNLQALIDTAEAEKNTSAGPSGGEDNGGEIGAPTAGANEGGPEGLTPATVDAAGETTPEQQGAATTATEEPGAAPTISAPDVQAITPPAVNPPAGEITFVIKGPAKGRWRAGRKWGAEPVTLSIDELDEDKFVLLCSDPTLKVEVFQDGQKIHDASYMATLREHDLAL